jgi:hypothetical protein
LTFVAYASKVLGFSMGLTDITGVFSRYFVVGFFLPAFITLVALWLSASSELVPDALGSHSQGTQLLILGGVALVAGLAPVRA